MTLGRVFSLCKDDSKWREFDYLGLEFKRVSAARLGMDEQELAEFEPDLLLVTD